ncbi:MAG: DUF177 domain-containing protein [Kiloniellales bacterium]
MAQDNPKAVEFSRLVPRDRLLEGDGCHEIEARAEERQALARRFGLLALERLRAHLRLEPSESRGGERGLVRLTGRFEAELMQACVVSLEPVRSRLEGDFELLYSLVPQGLTGRSGEWRPGPEPGAGEVVFGPDEVEPPELVGPAGLDLGEAVAQQLALTIDPYPRAPGAVLEAAEWPPKGVRGSDDGGPEDDVEAGPFAALRRLKRGG